MDGKRGARRDDAMEAAPAADAPEDGETRPERYGPVELRRLRKDDGRSLILFSRTASERHPVAGDT